MYRVGSRAGVTPQEPCSPLSCRDQRAPTCSHAPHHGHPEALSLPPKGPPGAGVRHSQAMSQSPSAAGRPVVLCAFPPGPAPGTQDRGAHLKVDELGLAVKRAAFELAPRHHLLADHPISQPLHRAGQDVLVHLRPTHRLPVHVLSGHLGIHRDSGHAREQGWPSVGLPAQGPQALTAQ